VSPDGPASIGGALFKFLGAQGGGAVVGAAGFAGGLAIAPTLAPVLQAIENDTWKAYPVRPPTIYTLIRGVATGKIDAALAEKWALEQGFGPDQFGQLLAGSFDGMELGELMEAARRGIIVPNDFELGLQRLGIEAYWHPAIAQLLQTHLSPAEAANARQQEFIGQADQEAIAALYGLSTDDADVQFELAGLPPGIETGLEMWRRNIIDEPTFAKIVAEGHTKTKYTPQLEQLLNRVLNADVYARLHLKGHISVAEMNAGGALTGYQPDDMNRLFLSEGRPAAPGQMWTAWARKVDGPAGRPMDEAQFNTGIAESDIRPEWGPMLWGIRFAYPPLFQINRLVQANAISPQTGADWMEKERYAPEVVTALTTYWEGGTGATADPHVTKAQNQLWTAAHKAYVSGHAVLSNVTPALDALNISASAQTTIRTLWDHERALARFGLTVANIHKAFTKQDINTATGLPWTLQEAIAELVALGYNPDEAEQFLTIG